MLKKIGLVISVVIISSIVFILLSKTFFSNKIAIELKLPVDSQAQLFYDTGNGYNKDDSAIKRLDGGDNFQTIIFSVPLNIKSFRLDFGSYNGQTGLKKISLKSGIIPIKNYFIDGIGDFSTNQVEFVPSTEKNNLTLKVSSGYIESPPISNRRLLAAAIIHYGSLLIALLMIGGIASLSLNHRSQKYFEKFYNKIKLSELSKAIVLIIFLASLLFIAIENRFDIDKFSSKTLISNVEGDQSVGVYSMVAECAKNDVAVIGGDTFKCKDIYFGQFEVPMSPYWKSMFFLSNRLFSFDSYTTFNFMVLLNFSLTFLAMFFLLRALKVNNYISVIGAFLAVNNPLFGTSLVAWITLNAYFGLILLMLAIIKFHERPSVKGAIFLILTNTLNFFLCEYYGIFGLVFLFSYSVGFIILNFKAISSKSYWLIFLGYFTMFLALGISYRQTAYFYLAKFLHLPVHFASNIKFDRPISIGLNSPLLSLFQSGWALIEKSSFYKILPLQEDVYVDSVGTVGIFAPVLIVCLLIFSWSYFKKINNFKKVIVFFFPLIASLFMCLNPLNHFALGNLLHKLFPMITCVARFAIMTSLILIIILCLLASEYMSNLWHEIKEKGNFAGRSILFLGLFSIIILPYYCVVENTKGNGIFGKKYEMSSRYIDTNNVPEVYSVLKALPRGVLLELPIITMNLSTYVSGDNVFSAKAWNHYQFHLQPILNSFEVENSNLAMKLQQILKESKDIIEIDQILDILHSQFGVDYILVGPNNISGFPIISSSNNLKKIYDKDEYQLYEFKTKSEKVPTEDQILLALQSLAEINFIGINQFAADNNLTDSRIAESPIGIFVYSDKKIITRNEKMDEIANSKGKENIDDKSNEIFSFLNRRHSGQYYYSYIDDSKNTIEVVVLPVIYNGLNLDAVYASRVK